MTFKPGVSGNPHGRRKHDFITRLLVAELKKLDPTNDRIKAEALVETLVSKAIEGDTSAIREILDRVEGKAVQVTENYTVTRRASEMSDDELAAIAAGSGDFDNTQTDDSKIIN